MLCAVWKLPWACKWKVGWMRIIVMNSSVIYGTILAFPSSGGLSPLRVYLVDRSTTLLKEIHWFTWWWILVVMLLKELPLISLSEQDQEGMEGIPSSRHEWYIMLGEQDHTILAFSVLTLDITCLVTCHNMPSSFNHKLPEIRMREMQSDRQCCFYYLSIFLPTLAQDTGFFLCSSLLISAASICSGALTEHSTLSTRKRILQICSVGPETAKKVGH